MKNKKYTLYFKGVNKYNHEHVMPILSLDLKSMDEYTSNYKDYVELFNFLPSQVRNFISNNLSYNINLKDNDDLKNCFFITDSDNVPIMEVLFNDDIDVIYMTPNEITDAILNLKMSYREYQSILYNIKLSRLTRKKYEFFKYLFDTYVKNKKIECMLDVYDTDMVMKNLSGDDLLLASIATDKNNIIILCKKLGQYLESRRNLALKFKELFKSVNKESEIINSSLTEKRKNLNLNIENMIKNIFDNLEKFKTQYEKEYKF